MAKIRPVYPIDVGGTKFPGVRQILYPGKYRGLLHSCGCAIKGSLTDHHAIWFERHKDCKKSEMSHM